MIKFHFLFIKKKISHQICGGYSNGYSFQEIRYLTWIETYTAQIP